MKDILEDLIAQVPAAAHVRARLDRVRSHHAEFGRVWASYLETRPHRLRTVLDAGRGQLLVARVEPAPVELSLVLGEILYELRAALDNALYIACVVISGDDPPPHANLIEWPICNSAADWKNKTRRISRAVNPRLLACLEKIQPYQAECPDWNCLRILNELARLDRHQAIHLVTLFNDEGRLMWDRRVISDVQPQMGVVRPGAPLVTFTYTGSDPLGPEHIDGEFQFAVDLDAVSLSVGPGMTEPGRPWGHLASRLEALHRAVWEYVFGLLYEALDIRDGDDLA